MSDKLSNNHSLEQILYGFGIKSKESEQAFIEKANLVDYAKFEDVFTEGKRNEMEYLLISGVLHRYNSTEKGNIITTGFYLSGSVITPHFARTKKDKSIFSLQALTSSVLAEIPVKELDALRNAHKAFRDFGRHILENELSQTFFNEVVYRSYQAKERLLFLRNQFPNLENLVPHHIIASYIGITNVSFSRLRNDLAKTD